MSDDWNSVASQWRSLKIQSGNNGPLTNGLQTRKEWQQVAVLSEVICNDLASGFSSSSSASDDVRDQQLMCEMTNRELIGVILTSKDIDALVRA